MTTIIERDVSRDTSESMSSVVIAIVGVVAILAIIGVALYVFKLYPPAIPGPANTVNIDATVPTVPTPKN